VGADSRDPLFFTDFRWILFFSFCEENPKNCDFGWIKEIQKIFHYFYEFTEQFWKAKVLVFTENL